MIIQKEHKKATLMHWSKEEMAEHIMILEHNINALNESFENQYSNCLKLVDDMKLLNKTFWEAKEIIKRSELKECEPICDYTKTDWNDCCECSAKDFCDKYNERSEIIGEMLGEIKNEGR